MFPNDKKGKEERSRPRALRPAYLRRLTPSEKGDDVELKEELHVDVKDEPKEDVELYSWKNWLLPRRPLVSALVIVSLFGSMALAYWAIPKFLFVAAITAIFLNRLAPYLFPVQFHLTEKTVGYKTFLAKDVREWNKFLAYKEYPDGVFLTHDMRTLRGRMKEGIFLYYLEDGSNKDDVLGIVESKLKPLHEALSIEEEEKEDKGGLRSAFKRIRKLRSRK